MTCHFNAGDILRPNFRNVDTNYFGLIVTCLFFVYFFSIEQSAGFGQSIQVCLGVVGSLFALSHYVLMFSFSSLQVITAGKPFQPGQLTSHVVATGKNLNMIQGQAGKSLICPQEV